MWGKPRDRPILRPVRVFFCLSFLLLTSSIHPHFIMSILSEISEPCGDISHCRN